MLIVEHMEDNVSSKGECINKEEGQKFVKYGVLAQPILLFVKIASEFTLPHLVDDLCLRSLTTPQLKIKPTWTITFFDNFFKIK